MELANNVFANLHMRRQKARFEKMPTSAVSQEMNIPMCQEPPNLRQCANFEDNLFTLVSTNMQGILSIQRKRQVAGGGGGGELKHIRVHCIAYLVETGPFKPVTHN